MPRIEIIDGPDAGAVFEISHQSTIIGRNRDCDIPLEDTQASRRHCEVFQRGEKFYIRDLGSRNGVLINGKLVREAEIRPGQRFTVGNTLMELVVKRETDDEGNVMEPILATRKEQDFDITKIAIKGYEITELIGKGGMGFVCKARQVSMDRIVAIKILNEKFSTNPAFVARFISEARAAGKLNHPNVIQVHDVGQFNNIYFFSMEYLDGKSVQKTLKEKKALPVAEAVRVGLETARALDYAHKLGIIHQDIKPDNIIVSQEGQVKLADLGISKVFESNVTVVNEVMGSPHYMSPEQALGRPVDGRSDIYSLGITLYQMLVGDTPFSGVSVQDILKRHVTEPVPSAKDSNATVPAKLSDIVRRMMEKDPSKRYQSAGEVVEALMPLYEKLVPRKGGAKVKLELRKLAKEHISKSSQKRLYIGGAVALFVLICAAVAGFLIFGGDEDPQPGPGKSGVPVKPSLTPPDQAGIPQELKEKYSQFDLLKDSDLQKAREVATEIISKWPEFKYYVELVEKDLPEIDRKLTEKVISGLSSAYNEFVAGLVALKGEAALQKLLEFKAANARIFEDYPDEADVKRIWADIVRREEDAFKEHQEAQEKAFNSMAADVRASIGKKQYNAAEQQLEEFAKLNPGKFDGEVAKLRDEIRSDEERYYNDTLRQADEEARKKRLSLAISILKEYIESQPGRKFVDGIRKRLDDYSRELENIYDTVIAAAEEKERVFEFANARRDYEGLAQQVADDEVKLKAVYALIESVDAEVALHAEMVKTINSNAPIKLSFDLTGKLGADALQWSLKRADEGRVTIINRQGIEQAVKWRDVSGEAFDKLYTLVMNGSNDKKNLLGLARILHLKGLVERAVELEALAGRK